MKASKLGASTRKKRRLSASVEVASDLDMNAYNFASIGPSSNSEEPYSLRTRTSRVKEEEEEPPYLLQTSTSSSLEGVVRKPAPSVYDHKLPASSISPSHAIRLSTSVASTMSSHQSPQSADMFRTSSFASVASTMEETLTIPSRHNSADEEDSYLPYLSVVDSDYLSPVCDDDVDLRRAFHASQPDDPMQLSLYSLTSPRKDVIKNEYTDFLHSHGLSDSLSMSISNPSKFR